MIYSKSPSIIIVNHIEYHFFPYSSGEPLGCRSCSTVCQFRVKSNSPIRGSVAVNNLLNNGGASVGVPISGGGRMVSRSPSCGKKRTRGFIQNGCIYECDGNILRSGTCATERSGTCGSCFGREWQGGSCS